MSIDRLKHWIDEAHTRLPEFPDEEHDNLIAYLERLREPKTASTTMESMVERFLTWHLPTDFSPDCGIKFEPLPFPCPWPTGTNLFTATQAEEMLRHVAGQVGPDGEAMRLLEEVAGKAYWTAPHTKLCDHCTQVDSHREGCVIPKIEAFLMAVKS